MQKLIINDLADALCINQSEDLELVFDGQKKVSLDLTISDNVTSNVVILIQSAPELNLNFECGSYANVNLFVMNESSSHTSLNLNGNVDEMAMCTVSFAEFNEASTSVFSQIKLTGRGAQCDMNSAVLSKGEKQLITAIVHENLETKSYMNHSTVLLEGGKFHLDATGKIIKGAKGSKSHQKSRALTFDQPKYATVLPQLLIDENDVEASHATTVGQIDENQMYYLQSRGLSKNEATQLITLGALMPIAEVLSDVSLKAQMKEKIEAKVNQVCSM